MRQVNKLWTRIEQAIQSLALHGERRLVRHAGYFRLLLAEGHLNRQRFAAMLERIALLPAPRR